MVSNTILQGFFEKWLHTVPGQKIRQDEPEVYWSARKQESANNNNNNDNNGITTKCNGVTKRALNGQS